MTNDAVKVLVCLFETIWSLFTSWNIPGTNVTPATAFIFFICAGIGFNFVRRMFNVDIGVSAGIKAGGKAHDGVSEITKERRAIGFNRSW